MTTINDIVLRYKDKLPKILGAIACFDELMNEAKFNHDIDLDNFSLNDVQLTIIGNWIKANYWGNFTDLKQFAKTNEKICYFYCTYLDKEGMEKETYAVYDWTTRPIDTLLLNNK
jgi:hypothetical protein